MLSTELIDPRPDLASDHAEWEITLAAARQLEDAFMALLALRKGGARLEHTRGGLRLSEGDWEPLDWFVTHESFGQRTRLDIENLLRANAPLVIPLQDALTPPLESVRALAESRGFPLLSLFMERRLHNLVIPAGALLWDHFLGIATPEELQEAFALLQEMPEVEQE
jgi:hypothetical protein